MNLLSLAGPRLDNVCQIKRKWYYWSVWNFLQSQRGPDHAAQLVTGRLHRSALGFGNLDRQLGAAINLSVNLSGWLTWSCWALSLSFPATYRKRHASFSRHNMLPFRFYIPVHVCGKPDNFTSTTRTSTYTVFTRTMPVLTLRLYLRNAYENNEFFDTV
jgi:hypothetical protein